MITKSYLKKLAQLGYSIIPVDQDKRPIGSWKKYQTTPRTPDDIDFLDSPLYGLVTGVNGVECIDVDLKVIVGLKEQKEWFSEYISFLEDNIEDFQDKVVIAKTRNSGFHILYRCENPSGNTKIARLEGSKEAILESRGVGGMVVLYDHFNGSLKYHDMKLISDRDREILWSISRMYDYKEDIATDEPKQSEYSTEQITPWADYNEKHTALDIVSDEFTIVRNTEKNYIIKRHGASSPHSGYIYKNSGCMYLFTTGTHYPSEKLLSPFSCYAYRYHNGDFTRAASALYAEGYGSRKVPAVKMPNRPIQEIIKREQFPIDIFPEDIQRYIIESAETLGLSIDYMGCAFIWMLSVMIGNSMRIEVKPGWTETASVWIAIVGKPGIGKTPSINQMIYPLRELNVRAQKQFQKDYAKYREYEALDKKEKQYHEEVDKPKNKQFIVGDITLEALIDLHEENPNSIGVFKDELAGWFKDMNKYRQGSDLEFWLSSWSGTSISLNRKTAKSAFVDRPFIPVLGGIQPSVFEEFTTGNNKENGFVDRILISYPELRVNKYNQAFMDDQIIDWYRSYMVRMWEQMRKALVHFDDKGEIIPNLVRFNDESRSEWVRIHDSITDIQNSDSENEYMKSMLPKQKSYIPRFALILNALWSYSDDNYASGIVHVESIRRAEKLSQYFINMAKLVKQDVRDRKDLRDTAVGSNPFERFKAMYSANPKLNKTTASEILEVSRQTVYNWIKDLEKTS